MKKLFKLIILILIIMFAVMMYEEYQSTDTETPSDEEVVVEYIELDKKSIIF